eukprot:comp5858_c0_seq1/m.1721 comp5858_c0_seq1/g.1721  ORF comp5858_c0_seq1/g.1721 comp5858_c0_seq1/m.1721 type:complete len:812 (-) comp5858_c0_seq1:565-3000(-)
MSSKLKLRLTYGPRVEVVELKTLSMTELCAHLDKLFGAGNYWVLYHLNGVNGDWDTLRRLKDKRELRNGSELLCVRYPIEELSSNGAPHMLQVRSYTQTTLCGFCGVQLWGLVRQGLYCHACHGNFHKECVYQDKCTCPSAAPNTPFRVPHRFASYKHADPVECTYCQQGIMDLQGMKCEDCGYNAHRHCQAPAPSCVQGADIQEVPVPREPQAQIEERRSTLIGLHRMLTIQPAAIEMEEQREEEGRMAVDATQSYAFGQDFGHNVAQSTPNTRSAQGATPAAGGAPAGPVSTYEFRGHQFAAAHFNIRAVCAVCNGIIWGMGRQGFKCHSCALKCHKACYTSPALAPCSYVPVAGSYLLEGWVRLKEGGAGAAARPHYIRVGVNQTEIFATPEDGRVVRVVQHAKISAVSPASPTTVEILSEGLWLLLEADSVPFCDQYYKIVSDVILPAFSGGQYAPPPVVQSPAMSQSIPTPKSMPASGIGAVGAPSTSQGQGAGRGGGGAQRRPLFGNRLEDDYELDPAQMLGQGQFGVVLAGKERMTGKPVAIKLIEWRKLVDAAVAKKENLQSEMALLKNLDHFGIVCLEHLYCDQQKLYLVMERAYGGDLLERILSSKQKRLTERLARFYMFQVVTALKYLHDNNIAHRDLKPENVLLVSNDEFTLAKLCDFGFARIVGENSFMQSVVGTPAYVAPEVVRGRRGDGYQLKVDLWSVGVICYVTLSGTFPYNEEEDLSTQICNAAFLFPPQPWSSIALEAKSWIQKCLNVDVVARADCVGALNDPWLQGAELRNDLRVLEQKMQMPLWENSPRY